MDEQSSKTTTATAAQTAVASACPHAEAVGERWGDPISEERQAELRGYLDRWAAETDHGERRGPFDARMVIDGEEYYPGVKLVGADAFWLAEESRRNGGGVFNLHLEGAVFVTISHLKEGASAQHGAHLEGATLDGVHLEGAILRDAHLERAFLNRAHLKGATLDGAHLKRAVLMHAHLEGASLRRAQLEEAILAHAYLGRADLRDALLEGTHLQDIHLEGTNLAGVHLEGASLIGCHLDGANLTSAHLVRADLSRAHLKKTNLSGAHLEGADLTGVWFDSKTDLSTATLDDQTRLADIQWGGVGAVNLTQLNWDAVPMLGDERGLGHHADVGVHERAVRAYRQLAAQLRAQGLSEVADRFLNRAQILQRKLLFRRGRIPQWLGSWFLALLAGYGYRPGRTILWYLGILITSAILYLNFGVVDGHSFNAVEAAVFSVTSFHGRGFFPGGLRLDDPVTVLAALEAVIGLLIEISFIATFTQRYFGSK